jgi:hypothetical protein
MMMDLDFSLNRQLAIVRRAREVQMERGWVRYGYIDVHGSTCAHGAVLMACSHDADPSTLGEQISIRCSAIIRARYPDLAKVAARERMSATGVLTSYNDFIAEKIQDVLDLFDECEEQILTDIEQARSLNEPNEPELVGV